MDFNALKELLAEAREDRRKQLMEILEDHQDKVAEIDRTILEALQKETKIRHEKFKVSCTEILESLNSLL